MAGKLGLAGARGRVPGHSYPHGLVLTAESLAARQHGVGEQWGQSASHDTLSLLSSTAMSCPRHPRRRFFQRRGA